MARLFTKCMPRQILSSVVRTIALDFSYIIAVYQQFSIGNLGAPNDPRAAMEMVMRGTPIGDRTFPTLNVLTLLTSKLGAFFIRRTDNTSNDYGESIYTNRTLLNATHKQHFLNTYARVNPGPANLNRIRGMKHIFGCVWGWALAYTAIGFRALSILDFTFSFPASLGAFL